MLRNETHRFHRLDRSENLQIMARTLGVIEDNGASTSTRT